MLLRTNGLCAFLLLLLALGLQPTPLPAQSRNPEQAAAAFIAAMNQSDIPTMMRLSGSPFLYRNQKWRSASDGAGFVLGDASDKRRKGDRQRRDLFRELAGAVKVQSERPAERAPSQESLRMQHLKRAPAGWAPLHLYVFLRGSADVEHIALIGVDSKGKVRGLYLN